MIHASFIACSGIWTEGGKGRKEGREEGREGRREGVRKGRRKEGKERGREGERKREKKGGREKEGEGGRKKEEREVPLPQVSLREVKAQVVSLGWEENEGTVDAQKKAHQNL